MNKRKKSLAETRNEVCKTNSEIMPVISSMEMKYAVCNAFDRVRLNDLVAGPSNDLAISAAQVLIQSAESRLYNPFCLHGNVGVGKTTLMKAIGSELILRKEEARVCYMRGVDFVDKYILAIQEKNLQRFREEFKTLDCLLLDDITDCIIYRQAENELFNTLISLVDARRFVVVASTRNVLKISGVSERLCALLVGGINIELKAFQIEQRLSILKRMASHIDCGYPDDKLMRIARRRTAVNEMIGTFHLVVAQERLAHDSSLVRPLR